jgi:hypothetical protein
MSEAFAAFTRNTRQAMRRMTSFLPIALLFPFLDACGSTVRGHTYHNNGGVVQVEFKSGGNAFVSAGFSSHVCTYSESGKTVNMVCDGDTTSFTVQDDGALTGPPNGLMARLTPVKN